MADIVSAERRSRMMSRIRNKDTLPELLVRSGLHRLGFRYRLHDKKLPGKPDIVLRKHKAVVFVHGCFWHRHECRLFKWPKSRSEFWRMKLNRNSERDRNALLELEALGWRTCIVWECVLKGPDVPDIAETVIRVSDWLDSNAQTLEISG